MSMCRGLFTLTLCLTIGALSSSISFGQLFTEDFDDTDAASRWTVNTTGTGIDSESNELPMDTNFDQDADGVVDDLSGFAFDYSTVGIPSAPNSVGGTTVGMKLQATLFSDVFGGFSVSPSTSPGISGDFSMTFDYWGNAHESPAGDGTTNLSYYGFGTSGTFANRPGVSDGIWFANTIDGDSGSDFRVYDHDQRQFSYQLSGSTAYEAEIDDAAVHPTDLFGNPTRDGDSSPFLQSNFGGVTPPAAMQAEFPGANLTDASFSGSMGWDWHEMEIRREGNLVRWLADGLEIMSLDTTNLIELPGDNILFGHSDINFSSPTDFNAQFLLFTLIDNIEVSALTAGDPSDTEPDGDVDGQDFLELQRSNPAGISDWAASYPGPLSAAAAVPEPTTWGLMLLGIILSVFAVGPRRKLALQRI